MKRENVRKITAALLTFALAAELTLADGGASFGVSQESPVFSGAALSQPAQDFVLTGKFLTKNRGSANLYFHTDSNLSKGYAVAINNDPLGKCWWRASGSLASVRNVAKHFAKDGEWFELKIKVHGAEISTWIDGLKVVEYIEPQKPFRTQKNQNMKLGSGTFALKHSGGGSVLVKDLKIEPLPPRGDVSNQCTNAIDEETDGVIRLHQRDFPVLNFHVHLKGGFTADWAFAKSRKFGINYAIAPNCGRDFELNRAEKAADYLDFEAKGYPFIICMQAEGREWHKLFGRDIRGRFAYVFTDAMTFDDLSGKRTHIWRADEVNCPAGEEQKYMDLIVDTICNILENEPADVYANPMRLPEILEKDFGKYWTPERRQRVLDSLAKGGKALEINLMTRLPDFDFIKSAKARGVKLTFGSNNDAPEFGKFEYACEVIEKCGLSPEDIFNPYSAKISK